MKRVWLINQWLPPHVAPTGVLMAQLAQALTARGLEVTALCRSTAPEGSEAPYIEVIERIGSTPTRLTEKATAWPRYARKTLSVLRARVARGDVVVVSSDPPLFYLLVVALARRLGANVIHWSQDVYPEVLTAYWPWSRAALWPLRAMRNRALRRTFATVVISDGMAERLLPSGARLATIPNWPTHTTQASEAPPRDGLVVGYSGNLGRAHEFDTLVAAAARLRPEDCIRFSITGDGPRLQALKRSVHAHGLSDRFSFSGPVPGEHLASVLAASDVHFVSLQARFDGLILPSKLYGIAMAHRPILFCGAANGEVSRLIRTYDAGLSVHEGDSQALYDALMRLRDAALRLRFANGAARLLRAQGTRTDALDDWMQLIEQALQ